MFKKVLVSAAAALSFPALLLADAIAPSTYTGSVGIGVSDTIHKTVTITSASPTSAKVDVMFMCDLTGSMGETKNAVQGYAASILSTVSGLGDVKFAVGSYMDEPYSPAGGPGDYAYRLESDLTGATAAQAAIDSWQLGWGNDGPESQLYALAKAAEDVSWREGSTRIVVWFGDYEGHDPAAPTVDPDGGVSLNECITALQAENIHVQAINVGAGYLDALGQASAIASATDGDYYSTFDPDKVVEEISGAISAVFDEYSSVSLSVEGADNVTVTLPAEITGSFDRSATRTFDFDVIVTGESAGVDDFVINALVDGGIVATEADHFTVKGSTSVPEPGSFMLLSIGLITLAAAGLRRKN